MGEEKDSQLNNVVQTLEMDYFAAEENVQEIPENTAELKEKALVEEEKKLEQLDENEKLWFLTSEMLGE